MPGAEIGNAVGWGLDDCPILGMREADGALIANARVMGAAMIMLMEYPYVMGCFTGLVAQEAKQSIRESMGPPRKLGRRETGGGRERGERAARPAD